MLFRDRSSSYAVLSGLVMLDGCRYISIIRYTAIRLRSGSSGRVYSCSSGTDARFSAGGV